MATNFTKEAFAAGVAATTGGALPAAGGVEAISNGAPPPTAGGGAAASRAAASSARRASSHPASSSAGPSSAASGSAPPVFGGVGASNIGAPPPFTGVGAAHGNSGSRSYAEAAGKESVADSSSMMAGSSIPYHKPIVKDGKISVLLPKVVYDKAATLWEDSLLCQFVGKAPGYSLIASTANTLWGRKGRVEVMSMGNEAFLLKFPDLATKDWVLNSGPWYIGQRPIFLRRYEKGIVIEKLSTVKYPLWMKIWDIPLDLFSVEGIGYIASAVGRPLCFDKATAERRIDYAKVCVEVTGGDTLPEVVEVQVEEGYSFKVTIEYPWKPLKCPGCKEFGLRSSVQQQ